MTGVPLASASMSVSPNGSSQSAGIQRHRAPASNSTLRSPWTRPTYEMPRRKLGPPSPGDDQAAARAARRLDGPAISLHRMQAAEEQVVVALRLPKAILGQVQAVVHVRGVAVSLRVVGTHEDRVGRQQRSRRRIAVQGPHGRHWWCHPQLTVTVHDVHAGGKQRRHVEVPFLQRAMTRLDDGGARHARARRGDEGDLVTLLEQGAAEPGDDALGAAVAVHGDAGVDEEGDMHRAAI